MIHESLLFRFNTFKIIGFSHLYYCPVGCAGYLVECRVMRPMVNRSVQSHYILVQSVTFLPAAKPTGLVEANSSSFFFLLSSQILRKKA